MKLPRWVRSFVAIIPPTERVAFAAAAATGVASPLHAQKPAKATLADIQSPIDSGFTKKNEKFVLTLADSFVMTRKGDTFRFVRPVQSERLAAPAAPSLPRAAPAPNHYSHSSHSSHSSHRSHRSRTL
jgi:hypothetical protein